MAELIVLEGGVCCGKTKILRELSNRGYHVIDEVPRKVIEEKIKLNPDYNPNKDRVNLQEEIANKQHDLEEILLNKNLQKYSKGFIFLDRSLLGILGFSKSSGLKNSELPKIFSKVDFNNRYYLIFLLQNLPKKLFDKFSKDGLRVESYDDTIKCYYSVKKIYEEYGYKDRMIKVPSFDIDSVPAIKSKTDYIINSLLFYKENEII